MHAPGSALISPTLVIVLVMVVLPILWTVSLAFQQVRLLNIRTTGFFGDYTLANFQAIFTSEVLLVLAAHHAHLLGARDGGCDRARADRRVSAAKAVPWPHACPRLDAVALRHPDRRRDVRLDDNAQPAVRHRERVGTAIPGMGRTNRVPQPEEHEVSVFGVEFTVPVALLTVIVFEWWRSFPFAFLFLTARLAAAPVTLEEAARVDGATPTQRFRYVILPQLMPTIAVLAVLRFIWTFNSFDDIYLLTGGGAGTDVVAVQVFNSLTARGDIGVAAAQALVLAAILAVFVGLYLRWFAPREELA